MIVSILTATGMAIEGLVKNCLMVVAAQGKGGGDDKPENIKEWLKNKLKALASLPGRLGTEAAEALPDIIEEVISWILNRVKEVVGWVLQNLWALVVGVRGLLYTYMVTRK